MKRLALEVSANFEANLDALEVRFSTRASQELERALSRLEDVIGLLRRQPHLGRPWQALQHLEEAKLITHVQTKLGGGVLREVIVGSFLVLYLVTPTRLHLLAMRHQREREFHFGG